MYFDADKWRLLMNITNRCTPKEYGIGMCCKKNKMRGGWKRK